MVLAKDTSFKSRKKKSSRENLWRCGELNATAVITPAAVASAQVDEKTPVETPTETTEQANEVESSNISNIEQAARVSDSPEGRVEAIQLSEVTSEEQAHPVEASHEVVERIELSVHTEVVEEIVSASTNVSSSPMTDLIDHSKISQQVQSQAEPSATQVSSSEVMPSLVYSNSQQAQSQNEPAGATQVLSGSRVFGDKSNIVMETKFSAVFIGLRPGEKSAASSFEKKVDPTSDKENVIKMETAEESADLKAALSDKIAESATAADNDDTRSGVKRKVFKDLNENEENIETDVNNNSVKRACF